MNSTLKNLVFWAVLVVVGVLIWNFSTKLQQHERQVNFSEFMTWADAGTVARVVITGQEITGYTKANEPFHTYAPQQYDGLANKLIERGVILLRDADKTGAIRIDEIMAGLLASGFEVRGEGDRILLDRERCASMGQRARQVAEEKYAWKLLAPALLDAYSRALDEKP